jgi:hypothetical protein
VTSGIYERPYDPPRARAIRKLWRIEPGEYDPKLDPHAFGEKCEAPQVRGRGKLFYRCLHLGHGGAIRYER